MKHRTKKKGHHGKHKHKHGANTDGSSAHGGDTSSVESSPPSPSGDSTSRKSNRVSETNHRGSVCEYCGAGSIPDASLAHYKENFDCANDCERYTNVDINCVTSTTAFQLRSPYLTAFYCQCGALLRDIHTLIRNASSNGVHSVFTEDVVDKIRPKLVAQFASLVRLGIEPSQYTTSLSLDPEDDSGEGSKDDSKDVMGPTCPFVMLLSTLLPSLHKFLEYVQLTKSLWWLAPGNAVASPLALLTAQLQLHCLLMLIIAESSRLSTLMEENQERDQDLAQIAQATPFTQRRSGQSSSSSSSSSLLSYQSSPGSTKRDRDREEEHHRLPQVKKISFEFDELLAEFKFELAELTEAMLDTTETVAVRLSRFPVATGTTPTSAPVTGAATTAAGKTRSTANEFVELLLQHVLTPLSVRVTALPSHSRSYIFPRLVERCISTTIDEYVLENGKWNQTFASQFEQAIELLRVWTTSVDAEYDKRLIAAPRDVPRLNLASLDAFKRLEMLQNTWLRHGKEGEDYVPRLTFRTNLETLRSTLKRTITARSGAASSHVSGVATPPPQ